MGDEDKDRLAAATRADIDRAVAVICRDLGLDARKVGEVLNGRTYRDPDDGDAVKLDGVPIFGVLAELARVRPDLKPVIMAGDLTQAQSELMRKNGWVPPLVEEAPRAESIDAEAARIGQMDQASYEAWRKAR